MATVITQLPLWGYAIPEQRREFAAAVRVAWSTAERRRRRVLAHPDIAVRLLRVGYTDPAHWTGYVPPSTWSGHYGPVHNDSPVRRELVDILRAVAAREATD
jgi:hypothetical protein